MSFINRCHGLEEKTFGLIAFSSSDIFQMLSKCIKLQLHHKSCWSSTENECSVRKIQEHQKCLYNIHGVHNL